MGVKRLKSFPGRDLWAGALPIQPGTANRHLSELSKGTLKDELPNFLLERIMFRYVLLALKGCAMGMADVVPGVSGGTIAFISGIYSELIESIKSFNPTALKLLGRFEFRKFWRHINGSFLFSVLQGIGIAIFSL
ncbi:protein containing DUF368, partial [human gut metagenome]